MPEKKKNAPAKKSTSNSKKTAEKKKKEPERDPYSYYDDLYEKKPRKKKAKEEDEEDEEEYEEENRSKSKSSTKSKNHNKKNRSRSHEEDEDDDEEYEEDDEKQKRSKKSDSRHRKTSKKQEEEDLPPPSTKTIHRLMPYILGLITIFVVACLLLASRKDAMGVLGEILRNAFFGFFGWPAWIIPLILINMIIFWRRYADLGILRRKIFYSIAIPILFSSLIHSISVTVLYTNEYSWTEWAKSVFGIGETKSNWHFGINLQGGGFLGGLFGGLLRCLTGYIGSVIIICLVLALIVIFFIGLSPRHFKDMLLKLIPRSKNKNSGRAEETEEDDYLSIRQETDNETEENSKEAPPARRRRKPAPPPVDTDTEEDDGAAVVGIDLPPADPDYDPDAVEVVGFIENDIEKKDKKKKVPPLRSVADAEDSSSFTSLVDSIFGNDPDPVPDPEPHPDPDPVPDPSPAPLEITEAKVTDAAEDDIPDHEDDGIVLPENAKKKLEYQQLAAYIFPPLSLLRESTSPGKDAINAELRENAQTLLEKLESFKVKIAKIEYSRGPTLTRYELYPAPGVKANSITNLQTDIAMALRAKIRIEAPIPGKSAVGVEVPNKSSSTVAIRELLDSDQFKNSPSKLFACLGKDITGDPIFIDIGKMPHLLIAGTTGSGKSVCINSIVMSLLYKARPDEVQLIMIDPKKVEMSMYNNLPHLRVPVVTNVKKAAGTLNAAVTEMERRYGLFEESCAREIDGYNRMMKQDDPEFIPLPRLVIIIDELADLMMSAPSEIETSIVRLAQKARAAGIHLIVGTQRPSVDVITGLIKANIPSRIAFAVASGIDSRTIIDSVGAEKLLGRGDMLFAPIGSQNPIRAQGTFVTDDEVVAVTNFVKENSGGAHYDEEFLKNIESESANIVTVGANGKKAAPSGGGASGTSGECFDELFEAALQLAVESGTIATSFLQRNIQVGFGRGAKIIDRMAKLGFVTPPDGTKPRQVLLTAAQFAEMKARGDKRVYGLIPEDEPEE